MNRLAFLPAAAALLAAPQRADAQGVGTVFGAYNASPMTLAPGNIAPLQLDQGGNVKIDCIIGCGGGGGGGNGTSAQGAPAAVANAWPTYPVQGGSAVSASNPLYIQDPFDGTPITAATMPTGGAGIIGWLSAMYKLQSGTLTVGGTVSVAGNVAVTDSTVANALAAPLKFVSSGISGAPTSSAGTLTASTTILPAEAAGTNRLHFTVVNLVAAPGASLYCTDDGSTPSATNAAFIVYAQGFYERDTPSWVPSAAIACIPSSGSAAYRAESYP